MRVVLKGIHRVRKTLADGRVRVYCYAWRGGRLLKDETGAPLAPDDPRIHAAFADAHKGRTKPTGATMFSLMAEFRGSADFKKLSDSSKRAYRAYMREIEEEFGDLPLEALKDPQARGEFMVWRDGLACTPRKADYAWTVLARVLSFGKDRGRLAANPCERGGRLYGADRKDSIWTEDHIKRFGAVASDELWLALVLALWTGQRQGDLLQLAWTNYDGAKIRLRQSKTGARVAIPVSATLRDALKEAATKKRAATVLTNQGGAPWTSDGFRTSWRKACAKAGIADVTFHDLRGTAVTRLAIAGCEVPEIAAITGHTTTDATAILDAHYLGRDIRLAEAAMRKLEKKERGTGPVNRRVNRPIRSAS